MIPATTIAGDVVSDVTEPIDTKARYVFYLHGQIVEDVGLRPTHPRFGLYDYPLVLESLAVDDVTVISERRPKGTDHDEYAKKIRSQMQQLLDAGVKPTHITVVGFSMGGVIAIRTSNISPDLGINFVVIASCSPWLDGEPALRLNGRVLSVFEKTDGAQSCSELAAREPGPASFDEVMINTGKSHGAFYLPRDEWIDPVLEFIHVD